MPQLALGARNAQLAGVFAEDSLDRDRFRLIAQRRARAVCVDVVDRIRVELAVAQRAAHRSGRPGSLGIRLRDVAAIGARAVTENLRINPRPAGLRVLVFLEYQ